MFGAYDKFKDIFFVIQIYFVLSIGINFILIPSIPNRVIFALAATKLT